VDQDCGLSTRTGTYLDIGASCLWGGTFTTNLINPGWDTTLRDPGSIYKSAVIAYSPQLLSPGTWYQTEMNSWALNATSSPLGTQAIHNVQLNHQTTPALPTNLTSFGVKSKELDRDYWLPTISVFL